MKWDDVGNKAMSGPSGALKVFLAGVVVVMLSVFVLSVFGRALGWFSEAQQVAMEEFGPKAMLQKYEWFKNAASVLDAKKQSISVLDGRMTSLYEDYKGVHRKDWDRIDKQNANIWNQEIAGLKLSYNNLAADWNAQLSKFNWRHFVGDLPAGAEQTLTKEYAPYVTE